MVDSLGKGVVPGLLGREVLQDHVGLLQFMRLLGLGALAQFPALDLVEFHLDLGDLQVEFLRVLGHEGLFRLQQTTVPEILNQTKELFVPTLVLGQQSLLSLLLLLWIWV